MSEGYEEIFITLWKFENNDIVMFLEKREKPKIWK